MDIITDVLHWFRDKGPDCKTSPCGPSADDSGEFGCFPSDGIDHA